MGNKATLTQTTAIPVDHYEGGGNLTVGSDKATTGVPHLAVLQEKFRVDMAAINVAITQNDYKESVLCASTANVNIASAPATIDGIAPVSGSSRVLLKNQTAPAENGIYIWNGAAAAMTRATDADADAELTSGSFVPVEQGTANADTNWQLTTVDPVIGTTAITFSQFGSGAGFAAPTTQADASAAVEGVATTVMRSDAQLSVDAAAPGATGVATASAEGAAATLARSDHTHQSNTTPALTTKAAAAIGTSGEPARADHKHDISSAAPGATGVATASGEGAATSMARSDHSHQSNTAPAQTTKSAAAIGTSGEPARADHKHDVSTAVPGTPASAAAAAEGSATSLMRSDALLNVSNAAPGATGVATASAVGVATTMARSDHAHQSNTVAAALTQASVAAIGTSGEPARADHVHSVEGAWQTADVTIATGELLALEATPKEIVAAPAAGKYIEVAHIQQFLDFNAAGYVKGAGGDLTYQYATSNKVIATQAMTGFVDQVADIYMNAKQDTAPPQLSEISVAEAVEAANAGGAAEWTVGDSPIKLRVKYRVLTALV